MDDFPLRFGGIARLLGSRGLERLRQTHVAVIGIGGVGSWAAEALARSGVGALTLVDLDDLCLTNVNRQVHACDSQIGRPKVLAMKDRIASIHPGCQVYAESAFFTAENADDLLGRGFHALVDAIDSVRHKALLVARAKALGLPLVVSGGAGGKSQPTSIRCGDLGLSEHDPLLKKLRRLLREEHDFPPPGQAFGVDCVYSLERQVFPWADGRVCAEAEPGSSLRLDCASGFGTASFVTGAFGFAAAARIVERIVGAA